MIVETTNVLSCIGMSLCSGILPILNPQLFDLICSDLSSMPISRAVAASNGFPGLFSPVTLTNRAKSCGGRQPGWLRRVSPEERSDPLSRLGTTANRAERYLDADRTRYLHLADGGISDNLAMRSAGATMQAMGESDLAGRGYTHVRRVLILSIDGQGTQDSSIARRKEVGGIVRMLGLVSGAQIDSYNFETLNTVTQQLQAVTDRLRQARCAQGPVVDGAPCGDVASQLIHISLSGMPESPGKEKLLAIPTGLTLERGDVDALVQAGEDAITRSAPLRAFIDNYEVPASPPNAPGRSRRVAAAVAR